MRSPRRVYCKCQWVDAPDRGYMCGNSGASIYDTTDDSGASIYDMSARYYSGASIYDMITSDSGASTSGEYIWRRIHDITGATEEACCTALVVAHNDANLAAELILTGQVTHVDCWPRRQHPAENWIVEWMWGDAGFVHVLAQKNPLRWERGPLVSVAALITKAASGKVRPVDIRLKERSDDIHRFADQLGAIVWLNCQLALAVGDLEPHQEFYLPDETSAGGGSSAAAAVVPAAVVATISLWLPIGASDKGIKGEKCGPEYLTEDEVQQAFKPGTHIGYYQANGAAPPFLRRSSQIEIGDIMLANHAQCPFHALQASTCC